MWVGLSILGIFLWILLAFWPARVAASKGRSFILFFLLSIPFWWITLFWVYSMKDETAPQHKPA
jgi:hypothetical protein